MYQNCKNWPFLKFAQSHAQSQHQSLPIPCPAQPAEGTVQWLLTRGSMWMNRREVQAFCWNLSVPPAAQQVSEVLKVLQRLLQLGQGWGSPFLAGWLLTWGSCWGTGSKPPYRPECSGHGNRQGERWNYGKSCSSFSKTRLFTGISMASQWEVQLNVCFSEHQFLTTQ